LEVADSLEKAGEEAEFPWKAVLGAFAAQLRIAVKAAEGPAPAPTLPQQTYVPSHREMIERAKEEFRKKRAGGSPQPTPESEGGRMAEVLDGPSGGVMVAVDGGMPVGARMFVAGEVYEMGTDGKLHFARGEDRS
jgi:hypothetical protein